jgi:cell division control protein 24
MQIVNSLADLVENWKGYILSNFGELLLHDVFFIMKNNVERVYRVFLFEKILLCCKEVPLTPTGLKKVSKKFWKQSVRAPLSSSGGQWQPKKDTTLLLKGRIFMWNITRTESPAFIESKGGSPSLEPWFIH